VTPGEQRHSLWGVVRADLRDSVDTLGWLTTLFIVARLLIVNGGALLLAGVLLMVSDSSAALWLGVGILLVQGLRLASYIRELTAESRRME
jgi:hypothetical protein